MKNRNIFFMLIWMCSSTLLFAQELFKEYHPNIDTYNEIIKNVNHINLSDLQGVNPCALLIKKSTMEFVLLYPLMIVVLLKSCLRLKEKPILNLFQLFFVTKGNLLT